MSIKMALVSSHIIAAVCSLLLWSVIPITLGQEEKCVYPPAPVPYITFMGVQLPNHSYVDIELLGNAPDGSNALQCRTDLSSCCDPASDNHTGQWVLPNGEIAGVPSFDYVVREGEQRIDLTFEGSTAMAMEGIFRCDIPTASVNDVSNTARVSVYVGLYQRESHNLLIEDIFVSIPHDFDVNNPQFTVSCVSSGGPVGCVVWEHSQNVIANPTTSSTLIDAVDGRYIHILTLNEHEDAHGPYGCMLFSNKPDSISQTIQVSIASASPNLFIEQITPTTIQAHWIVPPKISNENGFRIIYRGGSSGYVDVDDAFVTNTVITGFKNGANYTMSIVTTSNDPSTLPSTETESNFIQLVPGVPKLHLSSATASTISFSWTVPTGSVVDSYEIKWEIDHNQAASFRDTVLPTSFNSYTVTGLKDYGNATVSISVTAYNVVGSRTSPSLCIAADFAAGNSDQDQGASCDDAIIGAVVAGSLIIAIALALIIAALLVYHRKLKSEKYDISKPVNMTTNNCAVEGSDFPSVLHSKSHIVENYVD